MDYHFFFNSEAELDRKALIRDSLGDLLSCLVPQKYLAEKMLHSRSPCAQVHVCNAKCEITNYQLLLQVKTLVCGDLLRTNNCYRQQVTLWSAETVLPKYSGALWLRRLVPFQTMS